MNRPGAERSLLLSGVQLWLATVGETTTSRFSIFGVTVAQKVTIVELSSIFFEFSKLNEWFGRELPKSIVNLFLAAQWLNCGVVFNVIQHFKIEIFGRFFTYFAGNFEKYFLATLGLLYGKLC